MRFVLVSFILCGMLGADDFINKFEYGEMLYKNPRGVSCEGCHGMHGEGHFIGKIVKAKKEINISAPTIKNATTELVKKSMNTKKSVMPSYFLTDLEIDAIVFYLKKINDKNTTEVNSTKAQ